MEEKPREGADRFSVVAAGEGDQTVVLYCLDLCHKSPDFGERQYKSRTCNGRFDQ